MTFYTHPPGICGLPQNYPNNDVCYPGIYKLGKDRRKNDSDFENLGKSYLSLRSKS
jgi:hypothetical protein